MFVSLEKRKFYLCKKNIQNVQFFDVVIIGAGPAGLKCAEKLGNSSLKVLLLEKNDEIGPKVCAGGLTGKGIEYLGLPPQLIEYSYNQVKLHVNNIASTLKSDTDFAFTIDRKKFGQWQLQKIKAFPNIEIRISSKATVVNKDFIGYGHNEDNDWSSLTSMYFLKAKFDDGSPDFTAFVYPAMLAGTAFG